MRRHFLIFLSLLLLSPLLCCMPPEPIVDKPTGKPIVVNIALIAEAALSLQSENAPADLCGISIYCLVTNKTGSSYARYAYGLFDNFDLPPIEMIENQHYKIEFTIVKEGTAKVGKDSKARYRQPFINSSTPMAITNSFVMSTTDGFTALYDGSTAIADDSYIGYKRYDRPQVGRYSGLVQDFIADGSPLELFAKHTVFEIKPSVTGLTDGKLEILFEGSQPIVINSGDDNVPTYLISMAGDKQNIYSVIDDNYGERIRFDIKWIRGDGSILLLTPAAGSYITAQRRYSYPFIVKISSPAPNWDISFEPLPLIPADSIIFEY